MNLQVNDTIRMELITNEHASVIFNMVDANRDYLRNWLSFIDNMRTLEFAEAFVNSIIEKNKQGIAYGYIIFENQVPVGRIGIYKIDHQNAIGEIGYWLVEKSQAKGIINNCCTTLIQYAFDELAINRIEIKCATGNVKSAAVAQKLDFVEEGILREAELVNGIYLDLYLYALLKKDFQKKVG